MQAILKHLVIPNTFGQHFNACYSYDSENMITLQTFECVLIGQSPRYPHMSICWLYRMDDLGFMSFSMAFQSYPNDGRVTIIECVQ